MKRCQVSGDDVSKQSVYGEVFSEKNYAPAQEFGSGLHVPGGGYITILPRVKKALAFQMDGVEGTIIVGAVHKHPGVPGTHFLSKSVDINKLTLFFMTAVTEALKQGLS